MSTFGSPNSDVPDLADFARRLAERQQSSQVRPQVQAEPAMEMAGPPPLPIPRAAAFAEQATPRIEPPAEAAQPVSTQASQQPSAQLQQQDSPVMRDMLNALHLIHDEAVQIRTILERLTQ